MNSWKTALITLAIFALGGAAGSLVTAHVIKTKLERAESTRPAPGMFEDNWVPMTVRVMEKFVQLTPDQATRARDIMRFSQREILRLRTDWLQTAASHENEENPAFLRARNEWRLATRRAVTKADEEVAALLTPAQLPLFEEFKRKRPHLPQTRPANNLPPRPGNRPLPPPGANL